LIVALLGKPDSPTDGVEDYCRFLSGGFEKRGVMSLPVRVRWDEMGWWRALRDLWRGSAAWKGDWALAQYTALGWSRRGFPLLFLVVFSLLRLRQARLAVVFHDPEPYPGRRLVDRLRLLCQRFVMRCSYRLSHASILTVPLEQVSWLPASPLKAAFIPVGANLPANGDSARSARNGHEAKTIAVFAVTDAGDISKEVSDIAFAAKRAAERVPRVRLITLGRGSIESESRFRQALGGSAVEYSALGILPAAEVSQVLAEADVSLFARGPISTQRGSAIASIACGVPLVAYADPCVPRPLTEAGVVGVRCQDAEALAESTARVLSDPQLCCELRERSRRAHEKYFSWEAVAARFLEALHHA
jgi:glycosyltransferase involved in cell wall biosynthesis